MTNRFAKNLSHDQINVSTLKGEGELKNLELNEEVLTDLAELPSWLRLSRATCNRVSLRIQWTKLKSVPIQLSLDEVSGTWYMVPPYHPAAFYQHLIAAGEEFGDAANS